MHTPFARDEVARILKACDAYQPETETDRLRALVLLLLATGLRFPEAVTLSRDRIVDGKLILRTGKTGRPPHCRLAPIVLAALGAIPASTYFFCGDSNLKRSKRTWGRVLPRLLVLASVVGCAYTFRATFTAELLESGASESDVEMLLGHRVFKITERPEAIVARQELLDAQVMKMWAQGGWSRSSL